MSINKKTREIIYLKYDGRCAYCGRHILYKDMQVDHFIPKREAEAKHFSVDDISNLIPSCRMCNHYKRANKLKTFRRYIEEIPRKLYKNYIYKVGVTYGNIIPKPQPVKFYFEKVEEESKDRNPSDKNSSNEKLKIVSVDFASVDFTSDTKYISKENEKTKH